MAYVNFQTEKADYVFIGANHLWYPSAAGALQGIDALVSERIIYGTRFIEPGGIDERIFCTGASLGNQELVEFCRENRFRIFNVDVEMDWESVLGNTIGKTPEQIHIEGSKAYILKTSEVLADRNDTWAAHVMNLGIPITLWPSKIPKFAINYFTELNQKYQLPITFGRSLFASEKIENGIVNMMINDGHERPKIGIVYGFVHVDMVNMLKDEDFRREAMEQYRKNDYKAPGFEGSLSQFTLDKMREYVFDRGFWQVKESEMGVIATSKPEEKLVNFF